MGKYFKKYAFTLLVIAGLLGWGCWWKFQNWGKDVQQSDEITENIDTTAEKTQEEQEESAIDLERAMNYVAYNIADISPVEPVLGGSWYVLRIWAVEETIYSQNIQLYVEYEDGHIMRKVLLTVSVGGGETIHNVEAVFEPGEADWSIMQGEDVAFGKSLLLYERKDQGDEWSRK